MPEHKEDEGSEELYIVLRGHARFEIDGNTVDAPQGTLVFVPPLVNRTAYAEEPQTVVLAVGSTVGKPYEAGGWEVWAEFETAYEAGDYVGVVERGRSTPRSERLCDTVLQSCLLRGIHWSDRGGDRTPTRCVRAEAQPSRDRYEGQ